MKKGPFALHWSKIQVFLEVFTKVCKGQNKCECGEVTSNSMVASLSCFFFLKKAVTSHSNYGAHNILLSSS